MFELFTNVFFWLKMVVLLITVFYSVFALVILNQIRTMDKIIHLPSTKIVISIAILNLAFGVSLFIAALIVL